jgi:hypothetical protein
MNIPKHCEVLFKKIDACVDEGEKLLQEYRQRKEIENYLPYFIQGSYKDDLSPRKFTVQLTVHLLENLPDLHNLNDFDAVIAHLPSLKKIKDIGSSEDFKKVVIVQESVNGPLKDLQTPLKEFLDALRHYLNRDKSKEKKPESRIIQGFAQSTENRSS